MFKLDLEKVEENQRSDINICWVTEKAREFQKNIYSASLTTLKPLTVSFTTNCGILFKRWGYQTTLPAS